MKSNVYARAGLCALLCLFAGSVAAAPLTLNQLIARHKRAAGAEEGAGKSAFKIVYGISAGGLEGTATAYDAPGGRTRTEMALGPIVITTGSDGKVSWEQDGTGSVRIVGGEELAEKNANAGFSLDNYDPFKPGAGRKGAVTLRPKRDPATGCYVLDIQPRGGTHQTVYLDPQTYLVRKFVERTGGIEGTITLLAYQTRFGQKIPGRMEIGYGGLPFVVTAQLQQATQLATVPVALFAPPTPARDWMFLPEGPTAVAQKSATFPFTTNDNEVVLPVMVNGHALRLLLDSGAGSSFVTAPGAQAAGLVTQGDLPALGYGGASATGVAPDATLEVGGAVRLSHQTLHVVKDPNVAKLLSRRGGVDGAIGYELFTRFVVRIDYARRTLTLSDPAIPAAPPGKGVVSVPLKLENRTPTVLASVDGRAPARFLVDTGDAGALHLYTQYAETNGLLPRADDPHAQTRIGVGVGGAITETLTPGHTLGLAGASVHDLSLATMSGPGITRVSSLAGGIGNLALRGFVVTFDYAHNRMLLEPPVPTASEGRATEVAATKARNLPPQVKSRTYSESAQADFVPLLPRLKSPAPTETAPPRFRLASDTTPSLTLDGLLARHLEALGGAEAVNAIHNTRVLSDVVTGGIHGTVTTIYAAPDKEYEEDKLGILDITQGYDGKTAWQRDTNGNVRPLAGEELKDLRVQLFFDTNSYVLPGRIPGKLTLRPQTEPDTGNYIVDALPEGGKPTTLFFDPKTFFIVKEQHLDDNVQVSTTYSDYRTVDGARFPFATVTTNGTARYDILGTVTKIENNVPVPPGLFSAPAEGNKFGFVTPGAKQASVPFDMDDGEIGFTVRLNGRPARVFLDSGASGIALSQRTATQLGLKTSGFLEARGYGGSADLHPILINRLEVPNAVALTDVAAIAIDLPPQLDAFFSRPLAGFVGYDLLSHFVVRVDFPRKQLTFLAADSFRPSAADGTAVPIELDNNVPSLEARLDALPPARFLIDTGDESALRLYSPYIAQFGLDKKYPHGALTTGGGIGGESRARVARVGAFRVGGVSFRNVPADFSLDPKGGASLVNAGSLGSTLLSRFVLTFDYPHNRVFFAPAPEARQGFETRTTGLTLEETKDPSGRPHVVVADIQARAPAAQTGLSEGDEVLSIDGQAVAGLGLDAARRLLSPRTDHDSHLLVVQSTIGKPRTVRVGLFDPLE